MLIEFNSFFFKKKAEGGSLGGPPPPSHVYTAGHRQPVISGESMPCS